MDGGIFGRGERRLDRLARRAREGDRRAFRSLYRESQPLVQRFLARRLADGAAVEDLCARTFERVVARLDSFDPRRGVFEAWVIRIARNALIDHLRALRPQAGEGELVSMAASGPDPLARVIEDERLAHLGQLLRGCSAQERELLAWRYGDGLRHRAIAELCGTSEAAVRKRLSRILSKLRQRSRELAEANEHGPADEEVGYVY